MVLWTVNGLSCLSCFQKLPIFSRKGESVCVHVCVCTHACIFVCMCEFVCARLRVWACDFVCM